MSLDADLMELLLDASDGLRLVQKKKMFGVQALWADGRIFAMVYDGRIALKLPEAALAEKMLKLPGARRFAIGEEQVKFGNWFVTPEELHDDPHELRRWTGHAHALALAAPLPLKKARKKRKAGK